MKKMVAKVLREPLLHFMVLGALIYLGAVVLNDQEVQEQQIVVSSGKIKQLTTLYTKTWQRPPSDQELANVVQEYVLEQAAYYQGVQLGLDKNDIVITRRVRQKLDFIAEEHIARPTMTDEILTAYLHNNGDKFRLESSLSFKQVYLNPQRHGDSLANEVQQLLTQLTKAPTQNINQIGDRYLFKSSYPLQQHSRLQAIFGKNFIETLEQLTPGSWHGPVYSSFGSHLVYIEQKQPGKLPVLAQIKTKVIKEWQNSQRQQSVKQYYRELLSRYPVTIEWPDEEAPKTSLVSLN